MFIGNTILIYTVFMAPQNGTPNVTPKCHVMMSRHVTQNGTPNVTLRGGQIRSR